MEKKMKEALKDLIIRLEDAHKGYIEVKNGISNMQLMKWMDQYAYERKKFQNELEECLHQLGESGEIKTSFLGDLHRMFIAFKLNNITEDPEAVMNEIKRGATHLIKDYNKVLDEVKFPVDIETKLKLQRNLIKDELKSLLKLKEEMKVEEMSS